MLGSLFKSKIVLLLFISIAILFVYSPMFKADFVNWDDYAHLANNTSVLSLDIEHIQAMFQESINNIYIPLTTLSFAIEHHFFGFNPFVYHLDNILLHILVTILVFFVGSKLGLSKLSAAIASLLFGLHPMRVESVAWVTERKDVLYACFYMLALLIYFRHLEEVKRQEKKPTRKNFRWLALTTFLGILSMLAKPMALSLPLILFLLDYVVKRKLDRWAILEKIPLILVIGGIAFVSYIPHARIPMEDLTRSPIIWMWTFIFYLKQFLLPFYLLPVYQLPRPVLLTNWEYSLSVLLFFLVVGILWLYRRSGLAQSSRGWINFAFIFYFLSIFFLLRFDDRRDVHIVADRFMYLPSLGFCYLVGYGVERLWALSKNRFLVYSASSLLAVVLLALGFKTFEQCKIWQNSLALWSHESKFYPQEPVALVHLADVFREQLEYKTAEEIYRKMIQRKRDGLVYDLENKDIKINIKRFEYLVSLLKQAIQNRPDYAQAYYNLGELYQDVGQWEEAIACYNQVIELDPKFKDAYLGLGEIFLELENDILAIRSFEECIQVNPKADGPYVNAILAYTKTLKKNPNNILQQAREEVLEQLKQLLKKKSSKADSYFHLGYVYEQMEDWQQAMEAYRGVLVIHPKHTEASLHLANIYKNASLFKEATTIYQRVIEHDPKNAEAYLNLGLIHQSLGDLAKANDFFERSIKLGVKNKESYFELGKMAERQGHPQEAMYWYEELIKIDPENAQGYYALGNIYASLNENDKAMVSYLETVELKPDHAEALINLSLLSYMKKDFTNAVDYYKRAKLFDSEVPIWYEKALESYRAQ